MKTAIILFACISLVSPPAMGQYTTASLAGTVTDASGGVLPDARVTARNTETGFTQTTNTDASGSFLFSRLPVGSYELRVEKAGFTEYLQSGITLAVNQVANQTVTMRVGQLSEKVSVEANAELVATRTATTGQLVTQHQVVDLPLNGRGAQSLVFIAPGTVNLSGRYCGVDCHGGVYPGEQVAGVNGAGSAQVNYQMDGTDHNDTYINMNLPFPNPDALQEFNLQSSNFTAEYGNAGGGIVNIVTKSGTNEIHGSAFEFLRNGALNARNFFAARHDTLKRNQFGGTLGGPVVKNKLFLFGTYQGTRIRSAPASNIQLVPTVAERGGNFSGLSTPIIDPVTKLPFPNGQIPANRLSPAAQFFLKQIPLPATGRTLNFSGTPSSETENQFLIKSDYNLTKQQISGSYYYTDYSRPPVIPNGNVLASNGSGNRVRVQNVSVNHTYMHSATLIFVSTFGLARQRGGSLSSAPFGFPDAGVKIAAPTPPELSLSVSGNFSVGTNHIGDFDRSDFTFREVGTKQAGAHELRFGGEAVRLTNHIINTFQMAGSFTFNGQITGDAVADFLLGRASAFKQGGGEFKNLKGTKWGFFVQDNWRATQRLTLNLGVRWDPYFPYWDREGRVVCFAPGQQSQRYPNAPNGVLYGGPNHDPGCPQAGTDSKWGNVGPRAGFAYRLTQDGKTALRGGAGLFYTPPQASIYNPFANIAPFAPTYSYNDVSFDDPFGSVGIPNPFPAQYGPKVPGKDQALFTVPTDLRASFSRGYKIPLLQQWNLMVERQLFSDWMVRVGYFGNKGTHFYGNGAGPDRPINAAIYIPGQSTLANIQQRRPYQNFTNVGIIDSGNNTHYNSLQLSTEKRFAHGLSVVANYTWAKRIDDVGWTNPFNRSFDRGIGDDDVKHVFHFTEVYQLPNIRSGGSVVRHLVNGWSVNSIVSWQGGFPMSVSAGRDNALVGSTGNGNRADFLGGQPDLGNSGRSHAEMIARFFDTSRFTANGPGTFGTSGRNILRGPRYFNTDFSALKDTRITERVKFQFRSEFFNIFNNVNFSNPNTSLTSQNFGRITGAQSPRILQFGAKVLF